MKKILVLLKGQESYYGKTDVDGQISELKLTNNFIDVQIEKAEEDCKKNQKLYKTLGTVVGLALVIVLF